MNWTGKNILVVGMARSGVAAARLLTALGAQVTINDSKPASELGEALEPLAGISVRRALGCPAEQVARDAEMIVLSPGVPMSLPFVAEARSRGIPVWAELEVGYRETACPIAAITGTNGKSTTTVLLGEILKDAGYSTYVDGNIGRPITEDAASTTPEDRMVLEVSSYQLEGIDKFRPAVSAILNLTEDHLARHKTMEGYLDVKARIFMNQRGEDVCVLNADDPRVYGLWERVPCRRWAFSRRRMVEDGACLQEGRLVLMREGKARDLLAAEELGIPGAHNLENALAAAAMAMAMGVAAADIARTLRRFRGIEHRIETVATVRGVTFINDSKATNVDSALVALRAMKAPTVLIAGGSYKVTDYAPLVKALDGVVTDLVLTGDTAQEIADTCDRLGFTAYHRAETFEEAVCMAYALAPQGGNVLLSPACASFDHFNDFEHRGRVFKEIVARLQREAQ